MEVTVAKSPSFEKKEIDAYRFIQEVLKKQAELKEENIPALTQTNEVK